MITSQNDNANGQTVGALGAARGYKNPSATPSSLPMLAWLWVGFCGSGLWDWSHRGDVRAALSIGPEHAGQQIAATIVWRRRDSRPELKRVLVTDSNDAILSGVLTPSVEQHSGVVVFTPPTPGKYYCYYLPYTQSGIGAGFKFAWDPPSTESVLGTVDWRRLSSLPTSAVTLEPRNEFESFAPMELSASVNETAAVVTEAKVAPHGGRYLVFTESRANPVRMQDRLPLLWTSRSQAEAASFNSSVRRGEYFTFQVAIFVPADQKALMNVSLGFGGFFTLEHTRSSLNFTCFNTGGVGSDGDPFEAHVSVLPGQVKSLWVGAWIDAVASVGSIIHGTAVVTATGAAGSMVPPTPVRISLKVSGQPAVASPLEMDRDPTNMTRLRWLNSGLAHDHELVAGFSPVAVQRAKKSEYLELSILNRAIEVGADGWIRGVTVNRPASAHGVLAAKSIQLLTDGGIHASVVVADAPVPLAPAAQAPTLRRDGPGQVSWWAVSSGRVGSVTVTANVSMSLGLDGYIDARVSLTHSGGSSLKIDDVIIGYGIRPIHGLARMGMDREAAPVAAAMPASGDIRWRWSMAKRSSSVWVGSAQAGMRLHLKGASPFWDSPAIDPELPNPPEWGSGGSGGCNVTAPASVLGGATVSAFTGPTLVPNGSALALHFDLMITPFRTANATQHWSLRHFQVGYPSSAFTSVADVKRAGANVINIHQGVATMINPYINYPFVPESVALLDNYTTEANRLGMRVKYYYTVRELSNHAAEIWPLRMLGDEVYRTADKCGYESGTECSGTAWQRLHLGGNYSQAWTCPLSDGEFDAAIAQEGLAGRWLNYYIEGLRQSVQASPHIDGIYFDGILFDRRTMMRVRKVLERFGNPARPGLIDFHTGNDFVAAGRELVDANSYMGHWAYVDSLWIGEGFSYDSPPVRCHGPHSSLPPPMQSCTPSHCGVCTICVRHRSTG